MYKIQLLMMRMAQFMLGETGETGSQGQAQKTESQAQKIVKPIDELLDVMIIPLLVLIGSAGLIYSIVLGVQYSKAENSDKREEAKKRLVNAIIGFVVLLILLVILRIFTNNAESISDWIHNTIDNANSSK